MPLYEFKCNKCKHVTERVTPVGVDKYVCEKCGLVAYKKISISNFKVKGFCAENGYSC